MGKFTAIKFRFKVRTRNGLVVDKLLIHGRDEADAERKLKQMYPRCEILESPSRNEVVPKILINQPSVLGEPSVRG